MTAKDLGPAETNFHGHLDLPDVNRALIFKAHFRREPQEEITLKAQAEGDLSEEQERSMIDKAKNLTKEASLHTQPDC